MPSLVPASGDARAAALDRFPHRDTTPKRPRARQDAARAAVHSPNAPAVRLREHKCDPGRSTEASGTSMAGNSACANRTCGGGLRAAQRVRAVPACVYGPYLPSLANPLGKRQRPKAGPAAQVQHGLSGRNPNRARKCGGSNTPGALNSASDVGVSDRNVVRRVHASSCHFRCCHASNGSAIP